MIAYVYCKFYLICYFLFVFKNIKVEKKSIKPSVSLWFICLTLLKLTDSVVWATQSRDPRCVQPGPKVHWDQFELS